MDRAAPISAPADPIARTDDTAGERPHGKRWVVYPIRLYNGLGQPRGGRSATVFWLVEDGLLQISQKVIRADTLKRGGGQYDAGARFNTGNVGQPRYSEVERGSQNVAARRGLAHDRRAIYPCTAKRPRTARRQHGQFDRQYEKPQPRREPIG